MAVMSNVRRDLIREGRALLTYILNVEPSSQLVRKYVRAIHVVQGGKAGSFPRLCYHLSWTIRFIEPLAPPRTAVQKDRARRLQIACILAEMTPEGAGFLFITKPRSRIPLILELGFVLGLELLIMPIRLLTSLTGR